MTYGYIHSFESFGAVDGPGIRFIVFLKGCLLKCLYCHNPDTWRGEQSLKMTAVEVMQKIIQYKNFISGGGVTISGGEPLLQPDIAEFIMHCREMGYLVKLDTNGSFPDLLQRLIDAKLLNYIAMDIKTAPERYSVLTGVRNIDIGPVLASVDIIRNSGVEHEFRTTVVNELHSPADFERIGQWLKGEERYFLQLFVDSGALIGTGLSPASEGKMREYLSIVQKYIPTAKLRGI